MATTKIWAVKDNLKRVINYASNTDKTETNDDTFDGLESVLEYSTNDSKTEKKLYVSGINCIPATAYEEMTNTKKAACKEDGVLAFHAYQSFKPGEVDAMTAHKIGVELANLMWGKDFEVVVATHLDRNHIHNHFVVNSVSFMTKKRFTNRHEDYRKFKNLSDALCYERSLSVIESYKSSMHYSEVQALKQGYPTKRSYIIRDMKACIDKSTTFDEFIERMEELGYEFKYGKHLALRTKGTNKFFRLYKLDSEGLYSEENIRRMLEEKAYMGYTIQKDSKVYRMHGTHKKKIKLKGFKALYFRYMYLLGVLPKNRYQKAYVHPSLRDDIKRIDKYTKETYFIFKHNIITKEDLLSLKVSLEEEKDKLETARNLINNKIRRSEGIVKDEFVSKRQAISINIKSIIQDIRLCESIESRSDYKKESVALLFSKNDTVKQNKKEKDKTK